MNTHLKRCAVIAIFNIYHIKPFSVIAGFEPWTHTPAREIVCESLQEP